MPQKIEERRGDVESFRKFNIGVDIPRFSATMSVRFLKTVGYRSGQTGQTVNLLAMPSKVRILPPPPFYAVAIKKGPAHSTEWAFSQSKKIMSTNPQFDFWYAVNNTEVISVPEQRLETFGATLVNYHLVTELMDSVNKVRVREGKLKALRPEIITPQSMSEMDLDGFGAEAREYASWLHQNASELQILKYGFNVQKKEITDYILTDPVEQVVQRVRDQVAERADPLDAVLVGVDRPWEVCLLKLMVELVQRSVAGNMQDIQQQSRDRKAELHTRIERAFLDASRDASKLNSLADLLKEYGLFERYEDRFFAAVRASK
jgi:hypothetical protein